MSNQPILLIDLASLVHPIWHMSASEPDPNWTSTQAIAKVHALTNGREHVAICTDSPTSWRKDLAPSYKANRPKQDEPIKHQMKLTEEQLRRDGFPVWGADGFEADDVIASAVDIAVGQIAQDALTMDMCVASSDKDLLQLVNDDLGISVMSLRDGAIYDENAVWAKFGVKPEQMRDFLTLVGDTSDNVKGVPGIGPKKAADLLRRFDAIEVLLVQLDEHPILDGITPALRTALKENIPAIAEARELVTLRTDVPIPFEEIFQPRISQQSEAAMSEELHTDEEMREMMPTVDKATGEIHEPTGHTVGIKPPQAVTSPELTKALAKLPEIVNGMPWEKQLEPRGLDDARTIAKWLFTSRLFAAYGSPEAIFSILLAGRELGLGTMASLRAFHIIEGKPTMSADILRALVMRSGTAEYFTLNERTAEKATWTTKRRGDPGPVSLTYTIEEARTAKLIRPNSQWEKGPADMLSKTASAKLARLVYPELAFGLYAPAEFGADEL